MGTGLFDSVSGLAERVMALAAQDDDLRGRLRGLAVAILAATERPPSLEAAGSEGRFPLFDLEMSRGDCVAYLKEQAIPHKVPRSACVFCPYKSNFEWRHLRDTDPAGWARAVEVDEALRRPGTVANRNLEQAIYLHRSCLPLVEVDLGERDTSGGVVMGECEGMCGL